MAGYVPVDHPSNFFSFKTGKAVDAVVAKRFIRIWQVNVLRWAASEEQIAKRANFGNLGFFAILIESIIFFLFL